MLIFKTMDSVRSNGLICKYIRFTSSGCKDIGIRKLEFVTKTQFLWSSLETGLINYRKPCTAEHLCFNEFNEWIFGKN